MLRLIEHFNGKESTIPIELRDGTYTFGRHASCTYKIGGTFQSQQVQISTGVSRVQATVVVSGELVKVADGGVVSEGGWKPSSSGICDSEGGRQATITLRRGDSCYLYKVDPHCWVKLIFGIEDRDLSIYHTDETISESESAILVEMAVLKEKQEAILKQLTELLIRVERIEKHDHEQTQQLNRYKQALLFLLAAMVVGVTINVRVIAGRGTSKLEEAFGIIITLAGGAAAISQTAIMRKKDEE